MTTTDTATFTRTAAALVAQNDALTAAASLERIAELLDKATRQPVPEQRRPVARVR